MTETTNWYTNLPPRQRGHIAYTVAMRLDPDTSGPRELTPEEIEQVSDQDLAEARERFERLSNSASLPWQPIAGRAA